MKLFDLLKTQEIIDLFKQITYQNLTTARQELLERLTQAKQLKKRYFIPRPTNISFQFYEEYEEDIFQEFLLKILEGKIQWEPSKGTLEAFVYSILINSWCDLRRKERKNILLSAEKIELHLNSFYSKISPSSEDFPSLKQTRQKELATKGSCLERIIIKMWKPYLIYGFDPNSLSPSEQDFLKNNYKWDVDQFCQKLRLEMDSALREGKDHLPSKVIASFLGKSPNTIDAFLTRARKRMPWLGDLRHEME